MGKKRLPRPALALGLQMELLLLLLVMAQPLEVYMSPGLEQRPAPPLYQVASRYGAASGPQDGQWELQQEAALIPRLVLELGGEKGSPRRLHFQVPPK